VAQNNERNIFAQDFGDDDDRDNRPRFGRDEDAPAPKAASSRPAEKPLSKKPQQSSSDQEVIQVLAEVGARLKWNEKERRALKHVIEDLENRIDQSESVFLNMHDRISKTETAFEKRQSDIEGLYKQQAARLEKAADMTDQIEQAMKQYASMHSRLDDVSKDGAGMSRKIEEIEDAVSKTQAILKDRALVAPDQDVFGYKQKSPNFFRRRQFTPFQKRMASVSAMVALGLFGGWLVVQSGILPQRGGAINSPEDFARIAQTQQATSTNQAPFQDQHSQARAQSLSDSSGQPDAFAQNAPQNIIRLEPAEVMAQQMPPSPTPMIQEPSAAPLTPAQMARMEQITLQEQQNLALFEQDPDMLAAQLNNIEPAAPSIMTEDMSTDSAANTTKNVPQASIESAPTEAPRVQQAAATANAPIREISIQDFLSGQTNPAPLRARIPSDSTLPEIIKEVEIKAYEGVPEAQHDLAAIYTAGHGGVPIDFERAATWFRESAIQGVANARYNLGVLYHQGLGVPQDINLAVQWYRAAAENGHAEAEYNLGIAAIEGIGTNHNPAKAADYFQRAANGGIMEAAYNLGLIHENGLAGAPNTNEALFWYSKAADMGSADAKTALDQLVQAKGLLPAELDRIIKETTAKQPARAGKATNDAPLKKEATSQQQNSPARIQQAAAIQAQPLASADKAPTALTNAPTLAALEDMTDLNAVNNAIPRFPMPQESFDAATVAQIQEQLVRLGLFPGPPNGFFDALTTDSIKAYQKEFELRVDGRPTQALLVHMMTRDLGRSADGFEYGSREN
jgi:TPR repeat protein